MNKSELIEKYTKQLDTLKYNRSITVDTNTDAENELYNKLIHQVAEFIREIKNLNEDTVSGEGFIEFLKEQEKDSIIKSVPYIESMFIIYKNSLKQSKRN